MDNYVDLEAFEMNYRDAKGYHHRAEQFVREGQRASLVFNVASVALERYLIAICELYGTTPSNHNYVNLMRSVEKLVGVPPLLNKNIRSLDFIFGICPIDSYFHGTPEPADSERVLAICNEVQLLFDQLKIESVRSAVEN
jgi:hypothetical protein